jgi:hypothetical protein
VIGTLRPVAVIHDEAAYLLQAQIFARGHWTAPAPPLPAFFEQLEVLVSPVVASKYWPGESLLLTPGVWLGIPILVPVLLTGLTGALIFALARRVAGAWVAVLTWLTWISAFATLHSRAVAYMSETTTAAAWLVCWWGLLDFRDGRSRGLILAGLAVGLTCITRPLTGVALAIPTAMVAGRIGRHQWVAVARGALCTVALCAVIPVWSAYTTHRWTQTPQQLYSRQYMPFDHPGFGVKRERQLRPLPYDLAVNTYGFYLLHKDHHLATLPRDLVERVTWIGRDLWSGWRVVLLPCAALGALSLDVAGWAAMATFGGLVALYLSYAHPAIYTLYYLEGEPVLAFVTALGVMRLTERLPEGPWRQIVPGALAGVLAVATVLTARAARAEHAYSSAYHQAFASLVDQIPDAKAIVFVRYAPNHNHNLSLVRNSADPATARVWTAYDQGAANASLLQLAPDRAPYLFDEASGSLTQLR